MLKKRLNIYPNKNYLAKHCSTLLGDAYDLAGRLAERTMPIRCGKGKARLDNYNYDRQFKSGRLILRQQGQLQQVRKSASAMQLTRTTSCC